MVAVGIHVHLWQRKRRPSHIAVPETTDPKFRAWKTDDHMVMSWLINSMTTEVGESFLLYRTAKEIWEAARETYSSTENTSALFEIETRLYDLRQGDLSVTQYFNMLTRYWLQLDMYEVYSWKCPDDSTLYRKIVEQKRTFRFLLGLNKDLDEVRGRIMGIKPLPTIREAFAEVRREESRKKLMMTDNQSLPSVEGSAMYTHNSSQDNKAKKGRPWCDYCKKVGHVKDTCWKLHGKPADWKPTRKTEYGSQANAAASSNNSAGSSPFTKEQLETLQQLFGHISASTQPSQSPTEPPTSLLAHQGIFHSAHVVQNRKTKPWIVDSGASDHMTGDITLFQAYSPCTSHSAIRIADGSFSAVAGTGSIELTKDIHLSTVLYVPKLDCNLLSISKLTRDLNCMTKFCSNRCEFQEVDSGKVIGSAEMHGGLYLLKGYQDLSKQVHHSNCLSKSSFNSVSFVSNSVSMSVESQVLLWHFRLGHPNFLYLEKMFPHLFINKKSSFYQCEICQLAKHTRHVYSSLQYKPSKPFSVIHSDIWGPSRVRNINGARWFISFIDSHTRTTWTFLMKEKSETSAIFQSFHSMISTQFQSKIQILKTDNATDYFNSIIGPYLSKHGIIHISSCVDTPQQNGIAERKNRHLLEVARSIMFSNNVPKHFWGEAILTATYLINRMPSRVLKFKTPRQVLLEVHPHILSFSSDLPLRVFGCSSFVHIHQQHRTKLDPKSQKCIFLGYSSHQKGYKCYSPATRKVYNSMDVTFFENHPYFSKPQIQGENSREFQIWDTLQDTEAVFPEPVIQSTTEPVIQSSPLTNPIHQSETSQNHQPEANLDNLPTLPEVQPETTPARPATVNVYSRRRRPIEQIQITVQNQDSHEPEPSSPVLNHNDMDSQSLMPVVDDSSLPIAQRKGVRGCTSHPIERYVAYGNLLPSYRAFVSQIDNVQIPNSIQEALKDQAWKRAVEEEIRALESNGTWTLTKLPQGKSPVGCKWIFTVKYQADGRVERLKARLVAKGFTQSYGIDYQETFAPVAKLNTVRVLLSLAVNQEWPLHQLDVKNAFLNGELEEEVYMQIPPGLEDGLNNNMVCKLKKALYGLKQSPRAWFDRFAKAVSKSGYHQCQADHTLFVKFSVTGKIAILIVYVDDIILTGDDSEEILKLKKMLATEFEIKDLGNLRYFLGMEVARSKEGIVISQRKYILDLLKETGMLGCKPAVTPMESIRIPNRGEEIVPVDKGRYQRLVGKLIYLSHTRPDIAYSVSVVSQHMNNPSEDHLEAANRILRYLKMTPGHGLIFKKSTNRKVEIYTDASWAGELTDRRSVTGYCSYVWGNLVTWRSKKQAVVSRSSAESEYRALALGICEGMWIQRLLRELKVEGGAVKMLSDSQAAISIAKNPVHHDRTKHIEIDRHFISEKVNNGIVELNYVPSRLQIADILTKALPRDNFEELKSKLGLYNIYIPA